MLKKKINQKFSTIKVYSSLMEKLKIIAEKKNFTFNDYVNHVLEMDIINNSELLKSSRNIDVVLQLTNAKTGKQIFIPCEEPCYNDLNLIDTVIKFASGEPIDKNCLYNVRGDKNG